VLVAACTTHPAPAPAPPVIRAPARGGGPLSLVTAVDALTTEFCAHENACDRVGPGRRFATADDCHDAFVTSTRKQLNADLCMTGYVESEELDTCLDSIRKAACIADIETVCKPAKLCSP